MQQACAHLARRILMMMGIGLRLQVCGIFQKHVFFRGGLIRGVLDMYGK